MKICGSLTGSQIGLITEAFEQSTEAGGEGDVLPCSISLLQPDLTRPPGTQSLQIPAWHGAEAGLGRNQEWCCRALSLFTFC